MSPIILTTENLRGFKADLLEEIKKSLNNPSGSGSKKWLKFKEVRGLLQISMGTL